MAFLISMVCLFAFPDLSEKHAHLAADFFQPSVYAFFFCVLFQQCRINPVKGIFTFRLAVDHSLQQWISFHFLDSGIQHGNLGKDGFRIVPGKMLRQQNCKGASCHKRPVSAIQFHQNSSSGFTP